jgi:hypothetical protein
VRNAGGLSSTVKNKESMGYPEYDSIPRAFKGWWRRWHFAPFRNANGNVYVEYLNWNGTQWYRNYNWLNNDWNDNEPAARLESLIVLPLHILCGGSFFSRLSHPSTELSSNVIQCF